METWEKAFKLEHFIRNYIPKGWKESIRDCSFSPAVTVENYNFFKNNYQQPDFDIMVMTYADVQFRDQKVYRFDKWYIIEAIKEYFKNEQG